MGTLTADSFLSPWGGLLHQMVIIKEQCRSLVTGFPSQATPNQLHLPSHSTDTVNAQPTFKVHLFIIIALLNSHRRSEACARKA